MAGKRKMYPGVYPRGDGYAGCVKVKTGVGDDGKAIWTSVWTDVYPTQKEAHHAKPALKAEREGRAVATSGVVPTTVGAFRTWWIAQERVKTKLARARDKAEDALKRSSIDNYEEATKEFADAHADREIASFTTPEARNWIVWPENEDRDRRWQHNGIRRMFTEARNQGIRDTNPFIDLRLRSGSKGRKQLDPLVKGVDKIPHAWRLADCALNSWPGRVGQMWRATILLLAFAGLRPGELYGLERADFDFHNGRLHIRRQYIHGLRGDDLDPEDDTKNWQPREVAVPTWVMDAIRDLPTPISGPMWQTIRGKRLCGSNQHYYWNPIRTRFGNPSMDLYELRHFCGWWMVNVLKVPESQVALHLGHTDGGVLVRKLYGHADQRIAIDAMQVAFSAAAPNVIPLRENTGRNGTEMAH